MKKTTISLLAVMIIGLAATTGIVSAYRGDYSVKGPNYNEERHDAMESAFESLDYDAWYTLMTQDGRHPGVVDVVTEANFETFAKAHEAAEDGDYETASALRAELGLNNGQRDGTGMRRNRLSGNCNNNGGGRR